MTDDPYDKMLDELAAEYNAPGAVPREEMWARVQAGRAPRTRVVAAPKRSTRIWIWPAAGIAALLVLSVGIVIGRRMSSADAPRFAATGTDAARRAVAPAPSTQSTPGGVAPALESTKRGVLREDPAAARRESATLAETDADAAAAAYRLVVLQHLVGSEAAITAFRSAARRGEADPQVAQWARELLSTTRMLRASTVGTDATMRRLLGDLDLVLTQIAAYAQRGTVRSEDLDLIEESITKRGVIAKLRTTIPARTTSGGTRGL